MLEAEKATQPYGFLVKPFRERDLFVMLDIAKYRHQVESEKTLKEKRLQTKTGLPIQDLVGKSAGLRSVIEKINVVAPTGTSVLIIGESGTGKEKVAQFIHQRSFRKNKPLVTVNCGALPISLIESELFGHERGAFTGANTRHIGKFEQADGGTVFLDEIGELPLDAQVKLLRVLQEKEIERVGGDKTMKIDVRIITATNRVLEKEVAEGRFRLDLYYRLNVFPIIIPPLRERKEDIEMLATYFMEKYTVKTGRQLTGIKPFVFEKLKTYHWPGNIRELEHLIERSVLLTTGTMLEDIELPQSASTSPVVSGQIRTMEEMEREHILSALKACSGKVSGVGGAAELLDMPAQTLYARMKKLEIKQGYK
jgi:two-component system response regulator HydG